MRDLINEPIQAKIFRIGADVFGMPGQIDKKERLLRFLEEAIELVRSGGLTLTEVQRIIHYEFERPPGQISQEFGGAAVTLFAAAQSHGIDLLSVTETEINRVANNKEAQQAKHRAKPASVISTRATS